MLILTKSAASVIKALGDTPEMPEGSGLRIRGSGNGTAALAISAATGPQHGDQVVENEGARVFVEPAAATMLDDKVLDAQVDTQGSVQFLLGAQ